MHFQNIYWRVATENDLLAYTVFVRIGAGFM
jgi:hypothetical protein